MRGKVLLSVRLAALERPFEFRVPLDMTVEQAARLMSQMAAQMEPARYEASDEVDLMLCDGPGAGGQALGLEHGAHGPVQQEYGAVCKWIRHRWNLLFDRRSPPGWDKRRSPGWGWGGVWGQGPGWR